VYKFYVVPVGMVLERVSTCERPMWYSQEHQKRPQLGHPSPAGGHNKIMRTLSCEDDMMGR
jgi:hypothetical protein